MYLYIYTYIHKYIHNTYIYSFYMYIQICIYIYIVYVYTYTFVNTHMYIHICICICVSICISVHVLYIYIYILKNRWLPCQILTTYKKRRASQLTQARRGQCRSRAATNETKTLGFWSAKYRGVFSVDLESYLIIFRFKDERSWNYGERSWNYGERSREWSRSFKISDFRYVRMNIHTSCFDMKKQSARVLMHSQSPLFVVLSQYG